MAVIIEGKAVYTTETKDYTVVSDIGLVYTTSNNRGGVSVQPGRLRHNHHCSTSIQRSGSLVPGDGGMSGPVGSDTGGHKTN